MSETNLRRFWIAYIARNPRPTHSSIAALFHAGTLGLTRAVAVRREVRHG